MSRAEELSQNRYPTLAEKCAFIDGYEQADKDLALTWEDMRELHIIFAEIDVDIELQRTTVKAETLGYYEEALRRFNLKKKGD